MKDLTQLFTQPAGYSLIRAWNMVHEPRVQKPKPRASFKRSPWLGEWTQGISEELRINVDR